MTIKQLEKKIEQLEDRIRLLESTRYIVVEKYPPYIPSYPFQPTTPFWERNITC